MQGERPVVSHRIPEGTVYMHHAQERVANTPLNESTGRRGGSHNSLTRIFLKPSHLISSPTPITTSVRRVTNAMKSP